MKNDLLFLFIAIIVLIVFGVIVGYWFYTSSKDYVVDDSIKGFYKESSLNQRCMVSKSENEKILLPQYFEPQNCGFKQKCILANNNDVYGYCKSDIGGVCYNVYDCAPSEGTTGVACIGGICAYGETGFGGVLFSSCGYPTTIGNGNCDSQLGLTCVSGTCLYLDGITCSNDNQCSGGKCDFNGSTGVCISLLPPTSSCNYNYCQNGFGCDFINGSNGYCQPITKINGNTGTVIKTGEKGALCSIPLYSTPTNLPCNSGLVCNFDPMTWTSSAYGLTGYGICQEPLIQIGENCSTSASACVPPGVCSSYNTTIPYCQAPLENGNTGISNINYCGYGSTTQCGAGYSCINDYCMPNSITSLCGGSGVCINSLSCGNNKLGIFKPIRSGATGVSTLGSWQYIDLPSGEPTLPNSTSFISSYQFMDIDNGEPIIKTKVIYLPSSQGIVINDTYFWYLGLSSKNGIVSIDTNWNQVFVSNYTFGYPGEFLTLQGIKFTPSGNISINVLYDTPNYSHIYVYDFNPNTFSSNTIDLSSGNITNGITTAPTEYPIVDWDVDDKYNLQGPNISGAVLVNNLSGPNSSTIYYGTLNNTILTGITNNYTYTNSSSDKLSTFVRYIYNYKNLSNENFIFNGTTGVNNSYNLIIPNVSTSQNTLLSTDEEFFNGIGIFPTYLNNINDLEFYYPSNRGFRYYNAVSNNSSTFYNFEDIPIQGYTPDFDITTIQSSTINTLTYGNIDRSLYSLITLCS